MKISLLSGLALLALVAVAPAVAADAAPPYKAPPAATAFDWSGFYLGGSVGGGMAALPIADEDNAFGIQNGQLLKSGGAVGGVHAGYNWQLNASFLVGLEGDFNWSSFKAGDVSCFGACIGASVTTSSKFDNFASFRTRFGLTSDRTLLYVTAGPAWGHVNASAADNRCSACSPPIPDSATANDSGVHVGVAVGAGVEYALTANWILRGEYLHLDFASKDAFFLGSGPFNPLIGGFTPRISTTATADIARIGVSYKVW